MNNLAHYQLSYDTDNQGNKTFLYLLSYQYKVVSWFENLVGR